jgi:hypothetical protein
MSLTDKEVEINVDPENTGKIIKDTHGRYEGNIGSKSLVSCAISRSFKQQ